MTPSEKLIRKGIEEGHDVFSRDSMHYILDLLDAERLTVRSVKEALTDYAHVSGRRVMGVVAVVEGIVEDWHILAMAWHKNHTEEKRLKLWQDTAADLERERDRLREERDDALKSLKQMEGHETAAEQQISMIHDLLWNEQRRDLDPVEMVQTLVKRCDELARQKVDCTCMACETHNQTADGPMVKLRTLKNAIEQARTNYTSREARDAAIVGAAMLAAQEIK